MVTRPNQKVGIDSAIMAPTVASESNSEYRRSAPSMPIQQPSSTAMMVAVVISSSVAPRCEEITDSTASPSR